MAFVVDALITGTSLLIMIFGLAAAMKHTSAAIRHLVWCFGLLGLLVLPVLSSVVPWQVPVLPDMDMAAVREPIPTGAPETVLDGAEKGVSGRRARLEADEPTKRNAPGDSPAKDASPPSSAGASSMGRLAAWLDPVGALVALWLLGASLILARLGVGLVTLRRYTRRALPATGWESTCEWARNRLLLDRPVRILLSEEVAIPLAAGVLRPVVLVPSEAGEWADERIRAVLLHEMAHVKRRDILPHLLGWIVCALWWFHPLVWSAARRMRSESERACDDLVLKVGTRASGYANDLLDIVTRAGGVRMPAGVVPLAQRSDFEGRILAILESDRRRHGVSLARAGMVALTVMFLAIPLAAMGPKRSAVSIPADTEREKHHERKVPTRLSQVVDLFAQDAFDGTTAPESIAAAERDAVESETAEPEIVIVDGVQDAKYEYEKGKTQLSEKTDGRAAAALSLALVDDDSRVRLAAAKALGDLQDPRAVAALSRALQQDPDARVRAMAAWALGQIEDAAAVPALSTALLEDDDANVRHMAAEALGEIEDVSALDALGDALDDPSVEVRRAVAAALGAIEDPRAVTILIPLLRDSDVEVRRVTAEALGDIESSQAVGPLIEAAGDSDLDVRVNAIYALGNIEDARALPVLTAAISDEAVVVRRAAVDAIGSLELGTAPRVLIDAVRDPDREVRLGAVDALGNTEDPAAVPVLLEVVRSSPDRELQYQALEAVSNIESPAVYDALIPLLQHQDPKIRELAAEAIGDMQ